MKIKRITPFVISIFFFSCGKDKIIRVKEGYVVYFLENNIRFIETKNYPDIKYQENFSTQNFLSGFSFNPNCNIEKALNEIVPDTLIDENTEMSNYTTFLKKPLIFPARIRILDTLNVKQNDQDIKKFKMIYKSKLVEFPYSSFKGIIIEIVSLK